MITLSYLQFGLLVAPSALVALAAVKIAWIFYKAGIFQMTREQFLNACMRSGDMLEREVDGPECRAPQYCVCAKCKSGENA